MEVCVQLFVDALDSLIVTHCGFDWTCCLEFIYYDNAAKKIQIKTDILDVDRGVRRGRAGVPGHPGLGLCERGRHQGKMSRERLC